MDIIGEWKVDPATAWDDNAETSFERAPGSGSRISDRPARTDVSYRYKEKKHEKAIDHIGNMCRSINNGSLRLERF